MDSKQETENVAFKIAWALHPDRCRNCLHIARNIDGTIWEDITTGQGICHHEGSADDIALDAVRDSESCNAFEEYR